MTERRPHWDDELTGELAALLNRHSGENVSGTPDFILAEFLLDILKAFDTAVVKRADWRGESTELPALIHLGNENAIQRVRERAGGPTPAVQGDWMAGYAAAMRDILRALDGGAS